MREQLNIQTIEITQLKPYENNPRNNENAVDKVAESIKQFGFKVPLVIDKDFVIVAGHTRFKAAEQLGLNKVPCIVADDLTDEQIRAYRLADNKVAEFSEWDFDLLAEELDALEDWDMSEFGFEIDENLTAPDEPQEDNYEVELPEEPKAKLGDVYKLGDHRLMCGDSTSEKDIKKLFGEERAKCLFTSPPYNMASDLYESYNDNLESKKYIDFNLKVVNLWLEHLKGYLFWNISYNKNTRWEFIEIIYKIVKYSGLKFMELIVWDKGHGMPISSKDMLTRQYEDILLMGDEDNIRRDLELYYLGTTETKGYFNKKKGKGITNYWRVTTGNTQLKNHKACFPVELPFKAINLTTNENDIVADPFGGSGTTLIACEQLKRKCYMMELDPKYVDVIIDRWETLTGQKAELIKD